MFDYIQALNSETRELPKFRNKYLLRIHTRYLADNQNWDSKIPKARVGDKKYIGIIRGNKHLMKMCGVRPEEFLTAFGRELVPKEAGVSKYDGEKTRHKTTLKTHSEFKTITSVFNKRYGHGNWRIIGPKKLQHILRAIEPRSHVPNMFVFTDYDADFYRTKYADGIGVTIIVNEPNADVAKQLFKVVLKG